MVTLRWGAIDFEKGRMVVASPKTEHHPEGAVRIAPPSLRLREILLDAFHAAPEGAERVVPIDTTTNLRTQAHRLYTRAGLVPPPKVFVNMRASCATDWAREFGGAAAAKWCGHGVQVAVRHYHQVRPEDLSRATGVAPPATEVAQSVAQNTPDNACKDPQTGQDCMPLGAVTGDCGNIQDGEWAQLDSNQ